MWIVFALLNSKETFISLKIMSVLPSVQQSLMLFALSYFPSCWGLWYIDGGRLDIPLLSPDHIEAVYRPKGGEAEGVAIATMYSDSNHGGHINITSLDGQEILFARHSRLANVSLLRIMGHSLFIRKLHREGPSLVDFAVPSEVSHWFDAAVRRHHLPAHFLRVLDAESANHTKALAFAMLFATPELDHAADACHALGNYGLLGSESPAAFMLYSLVAQFMRLKEAMSTDQKPSDIEGETLEMKKLKRKLEVESPGVQVESPNPPNSIHVVGSLRRLPGSSPHVRRHVDSPARVRRHVWRFMNPVCLNLWELYQRSSFLTRYHLALPCPRCPVGPTCLGMCGPSCTQCWWFLCGRDCCYHQGCFEHDWCCLEFGFSHPSCFFPVFSFSCDSYEC